MRVFYSDICVPRLDHAVITVGSYDGVHFGHRQLLNTVKLRASQLGAQSVVVTFAPHPRQVLASGDYIRLLNSLPEKLFLLQEAGIDNVIVIKFDSNFARMPYDSFVRDILVDTIGMNYMVLGYNHHFGNNRQGNFSSIEQLSSRCGFVAERIERSDVQGQKVSSTVIRTLIASGQMQKARQLLTRPYLIMADVDAQGKIHAGEKDKLLPPAGCYPVSVKHGVQVDYFAATDLSDTVLQEEQLFDAMLEVRNGECLLVATNVHEMKNAVINFV